MSPPEKNIRTSLKIKKQTVWSTKPFFSKTQTVVRQPKHASESEYRKLGINFRHVMGKFFVVRLVKTSSTNTVYLFTFLSYSQKGTIGMMYNQEDLPWTAEGIVPDIIVNPHAIPSRMTIGHVFECVASKLAALLGVRIDATAFSHKPVDVICDMLRKAGFSEDGREVMYHPHTGKRLKGRVFIGPTFYQRLKHMVEDKIHARARGKVVGLTRQPVDGRANGGGLRWGEMERDCGRTAPVQCYMNA